LQRSSHCARYHVLLYLTGDQDLADLSHVLSGLVALHSRNWLTLTLAVLAREDRELSGQTGVAAMTVTSRETGNVPRGSKCLGTETASVP